MPLEIVDGGVRNSWWIDDWFRENGAGQVRFVGDDNALTIARPLSCAALDITLGGGSRAAIGAGGILGRISVHAESRGVLEIGEGCGFNGHTRISLHEPAAVRIGAECLFADGVEITVSDMHTIYDIGSGERVNPARDVTVGAHVWLGAQAVLLKGAHVGAGAIIGLRAVVTGVIPPNCVAAGVPARVIRRGVTWRPDLVPPA